MTTFSFTLTLELKTSLEVLDSIRTKLLTAPLSPKTELSLKWESSIDRIYYSLLLSGIKLKRKEVLDTLTSSAFLKKPKKLTPEQIEIIKYKKAMDIISNNWLVSDKILTPKTVIALHGLAAPGKYKRQDQELRQILDYLLTGADHPVVQAAIVYAAMEDLHPFSDGNGRISRLLSYLFLYKSGFDARGFISIEEKWHKEQELFKENLDQGIHAAHMTVWIEYFAKSLLENLEYKLQTITNSQTTVINRKNFTYLNDRQKEILTLLDEPEASITNRAVQKHFSISQITASRDLSHLATLGLLIPRGRGRSVYYTKV